MRHGPGATLLRHYRESEPRRFASLLRAAMKRAKGRIPQAARALSVSQAVLFKWLKRDARLLGKIVRAPRGRPIGTSNKK